MLCAAIMVCSVQQFYITRDMYTSKEICIRQKRPTDSQKDEQIRIHRRCALRPVQHQKQSQKRPVHIKRDLKTTKKTCIYLKRPTGVKKESHIRKISFDIFVRHVLSNMGLFSRFQIFFGYLGVSFRIPPPVGLFKYKKNPKRRKRIPDTEKSLSTSLSSMSCQICRSLFVFVFDNRGPHQGFFSYTPRSLLTSSSDIFGHLFMFIKNVMHNLSKSFYTCAKVYSYLFVCVC